MPARPWTDAIGLPWLRAVDASTLRADLMAGLLGAVLALPQGIAFATLAGLPPQFGLYAAVVPCIVAALAGSSRHVVTGPTNATSLALLAMLVPLALPGSPEYIALALAVTVLVGAIQLAVGLLRLGALADFVSPSVLLGFTSGAAVLIAVHALKDLAGLRPPGGGGAMDVLAHAGRVLAQAPGTLDAAALVVGGVTLAVALVVRRLGRRWPYMLAGLVAGGLTAVAIERGLAAPLMSALPSSSLRPVAVVGPIPSSLPPFGVPRIDWRALPELLGLAAALAVVALGQSIAIAKALAARSGQRIDANREFVGQGLANVIGGFFSSYVACGSLNRSLPNLEAGARTPLAGVFAGLMVLALVAVSAPLLARIPTAAVAALLVLVAWQLLDLARMRRLARLSRAEFGIATATLVATVMLRLELAILLGVLLSLVAYLYRTSRPPVRPLLPDPHDPMRRFTPIDELPGHPEECPQLKLLRMEGSVFFGAVPHVAERLHAFRTERPAQRHLLVMAKSMNFVDLAGAEMWQAELQARRAMGCDLYFHRPRAQVLDAWRRTGFSDALGPGRIFGTKREAISTIYARLDPAVCASCTARAFEECAARAAPPRS